MTELSFRMLCIRSDVDKRSKAALCRKRRPYIAPSERNEWSVEWTKTDRVHLRNDVAQLTTTTYTLVCEHNSQNLCRSLKQMYINLE